MSKILTIVVPTYNIEKYISKNIESFQAVDIKYKSLFEVLIVNDGSKDNTMNIVKKLIDQDKVLDIKLISKENGGHGSTINRGLQEAKGKYFKVIDGDDWINVSAFEQLLDTLTQVDVDLVITDFTEQHVYNDTTKYINFPFLISNQIVHDLPSGRIHMHATTYKTEILLRNNIKLSEKTFYVDIQYTLFPLEYIKSYYYLPLDVYQYFLGRSGQSMDIKNMVKNAKDHLIVTMSILDLFSKQIPNNNWKNIINLNLDYLINTQFNLSSMSNNKDELIDKLITTIQKNNYPYKFNYKYKLAYLTYINHITNKKFDFIVQPIINKKIKQLKVNNNID